MLIQATHSMASFIHVAIVTDFITNYNYSHTKHKGNPAEIIFTC